MWLWKRAKDRKEIKMNSTSFNLVYLLKACFHYYFMVIALYQVYVYHPSILSRHFYEIRDILAKKEVSLAL